MTPVEMIDEHTKLMMSSSPDTETEERILHDDWFKCKCELARRIRLKIIGSAHDNI